MTHTPVECFLFFLMYFMFFLQVCTACKPADCEVAQGAGNWTQAPKQAFWAAKPSL